MQWKVSCWFKIATPWNNYNPLFQFRLSSLLLSSFSHQNWITISIFHSSFRRYSIGGYVDFIVIFIHKFCQLSTHRYLCSDWAGHGTYKWIIRWIVRESFSMEKQLEYDTPSLFFFRIMLTKLFSKRRWYFIVFISRQK